MSAQEEVLAKLNAMSEAAARVAGLAQQMDNANAHLHVLVHGQWTGSTVQFAEEILRRVQELARAVTAAHGQAVTLKERIDRGRDTVARL